MSLVKFLAIVDAIVLGTTGAFYISSVQGDLPENTIVPTQTVPATLRKPPQPLEPFTPTVVYISTPPPQVLLKSYDLYNVDHIRDKDNAATLYDPAAQEHFQNALTWIRQKPCQNPGTRTCPSLADIRQELERAQSYIQNSPAYTLIESEGYPPYRQNDLDKVQDVLDKTGLAWTEDRLSNEYAGLVGLLRQMREEKERQLPPSKEDCSAALDIFTESFRAVLRWSADDPEQGQALTEKLSLFEQQIDILCPTEKAFIPSSPEI